MARPDHGIKYAAVHSVEYNSAPSLQDAQTQVVQHILDREGPEVAELRLSMAVIIHLYISHAGERIHACPVSYDARAGIAVGGNGDILAQGPVLEHPPAAVVRVGPPGVGVAQVPAFKMIVLVTC